MKWISSLEHWHKAPRSLIGGKAAALQQLYLAGVTIPRTACLSTAAYDTFLNANGLREKIQLELNMKPFSEMRWEEIWDTALRIRHLFLTAPFPEPVASQLLDCVRETFGDVPLAVRSSAPEEDQRSASFAGLHESVLNVRGEKQLLAAIRKVWTSLWSDRALLYRQELKLAPGKSAMAVIIQELVASEVSGVAFTRDPLNADQMVIEAVHGLNQGLVDGDIEPDRWQVARDSGQVMHHFAPQERSHFLTASATGVTLRTLPPERSTAPPLNQNRLSAVIGMMMRLEKFFGQPLDLEWTWQNDRLQVLQARPVTATRGAPGTDQRSWYLSLHRSFTNLLQLEETIAGEMLPQMDREAAAMASQNLADLADDQLAAAIRSRFERAAHWSKVYWDDCIPFAHGIRLFGEIYNDLMTPDDPYQFVQLLAGEAMLSTSRNAQLQQLADLVRESPELRRQLTAGGSAAVDDPRFRATLTELEARFGNYFSGLPATGRAGRDMLGSIILEYMHLEGGKTASRQTERQQLEQHFLTLAAEAQLGMDGSRLLALARASYRLRDDDNIYLGRIEQQLQRAVREGKHRLLEHHDPQALDLAPPEEVARLLTGEEQHLSARPAASREQQSLGQHQAVRARQLPGQPASQGVARGRARVIAGPEDMGQFSVGEVLIVDAIDPNMTFLAPLAAAIVERRGGMLIHGAIIAREYGIPCVTGVGRVTELIQSGDTVTVDGYLGLVTVDKTR